MSTSSIDSLLDATIDDLSDIPEFKPFPIGAHRASIKWDYTKKVNDKTVVELSVTAIETLELSNPEDTPTKAGDSTNILFQFTKKDGTPNELAQGLWKALLKPLQEHFKTASNRETMDASQGAEVLIVTNMRSDKKDPNNIKYYTDIKNLQVI